MHDLTSFLSGRVPGGIFLLIFLIISIHLTFRFLRSSQLIFRSGFIRGQRNVFAIVLLLYLTLWIVLRPPQPRLRIIILPTQSVTQNINMQASSWILAESIQHTKEYLKERYLLHRWEWLLQTMAEDSLPNARSWHNLARRMQPGIIISSRILPGGNVICRVEHLEDASENFELPLSSITAADELLQALDEKAHYYSRRPVIPVRPDSAYLDCKLLYTRGQFDNVIERYGASADRDTRIIVAAAHAQKGLRIKRDREKAQYTKIVNPEFEKARRILYPIIEAGRDNARLAYLLGRMAIHEEEYEKAEIFLKRALIDDPQDARIYYALSFLLPARLHDLGYESRQEVLRKSVALDPGFANAVYSLATDYYRAGTGTQTGMGTTRALAVAEAFLKIRPDDVRIRNLLASIYVRTSRFSEALAIYEDLNRQAPGDSNILYNLGSVYYMLNDYDTAISYFQQAIALDGNPDAYLYLGLIYREQGELQKALEYFRERVRRKSGADDIYAKEAMTGIRKILEELQNGDQPVDEN